MKITDIKCYRSKVPLVTPFKTALRSVDHIEDFVIIIETDSGEVGVGSAPSTPIITGDTHDSIYAAITQIIFPRLKGRYIAELNDLLALVHTSILTNYSAKAAVETALYDLWGKLNKAPLYQLFGGKKSELHTDITISVDSIDKMLQDCELALEAGFGVLKVKIGLHLDDDIKRIKAIHDGVRNRAKLRLDVNQGWTAKQTVFAVNQLEAQGVNLELIEQPVKANDIQGMRFISQHTVTPIMADESAFSPEQVIELITTGAADIINIKLMKTGGLSRAIRIADIADTYHIPCMMGCMLEGNIGVTAAAHLAVARSKNISLIDLDGPILGQYDPVCGGANFEGAKVTLSDGYGLGIEKVDGLIDF
ncbi:L-Ala-D/L-Glu epimerase [Alteromonas sp. 38]|uniref:dipeptide epimerase n=1 Tax=unclassified Alteromonas TaxID=2614992 RepID=UPI0012F0FA48|nr:MULTISPECIES: dipeptide epimerase [unclassified Alteromonas]CAD5285004.1 L-Ala-D/L-Glu epimerase [Alteromonas sp. 154]VXB39919.1 L-Ala-D/L-Glu epimerase [Alteromonas sp. 38]